MKPFSPKIFGHSVIKKCAGNIDELKLHICEFYLAGWNAGFIASWFDFSETIVLEIILNENLPLQKKSNSIRHNHVNKAVKKCCTQCGRNFKTAFNNVTVCSSRCLQTIYNHNAESIKINFNYPKEKDVIMKIQSYGFSSNMETVLHERP